MTKTYVVEGMTCEHCVKAVTEEVSAIPGTPDVQVDLASGRVAVTGEHFSDADVQAAVEEAGYTIREQ